MGHEAVIYGVIVAPMGCIASALPFRVRVGAYEARIRWAASSDALE